MNLEDYSRVVLKVFRGDRLREISFISSDLFSWRQEQRRANSGDPPFRCRRRSTASFLRIPFIPGADVPCDLLTSLSKRFIYPKLGTTNWFIVWLIYYNRYISIYIIIYYDCKWIESKWGRHEKTRSMNFLYFLLI